jgi:hypothetical protein
MKPSRSKRSPSDKTYQGTVIIPYVKDIYEKLRRIGNRFNVRTIIKCNIYILWDTDGNWTVRNNQQKEQCVYNIPCDCGRCYIGETKRNLEVRISEHKYTLTLGLL